MVEPSDGSSLVISVNPSSSAGFLSGGALRSESPLNKEDGSESTVSSKLGSSRLRLRDSMSPRPSAHDEYDNEEDDQQQHQHHHTYHLSSNSNNQHHPHYGTSIGSAHSTISEAAYGWFEFDDYLDSDLGKAGDNQADHMDVLNRLESMREMDFMSPTSPAIRSIPMMGGGGGAVSPTKSSSSSSTSSSSNSNHHHHHSSNRRRQKKRILFHLSQRNFTITTKVFEDYETSRTYFLALGLGGFRIVQNSGGQHAEYNVIICMNHHTYCTWKRYNHFSELMKEAQLAQSERHLIKTLAAWDYMERKRKWWRCLDIRYLAQKLSHIEAFLKELVYEIRSPEIIIRFASGDLALSDGHPTTQNVVIR